MCVFAAGMDDRTDRHLHGGRLRARARYHRTRRPLLLLGVPLLFSPLARHHLPLVLLAKGPTLLVMPLYWCPLSSALLLPLMRAPLRLFLSALP